MYPEEGITELCTREERKGGKYAYCKPEMYYTSEMKLPLQFHKAVIFV